MTFKHKLSARMALLKDRLVLIPVIGLLACEKPVHVTGPVSSDVVQLVVSPKSLTLFPDQTVQFVAAGLTAAGDTGPVQVNWSWTGGTIMETGSSGGRHYGHYKSSGQPGRYKVVASGSPGPVIDSATVTVAPVPVASVALSPASASLFLGQSVQLTATPLDSVGGVLTGRIVTWTSSNPSVATVTASGLVTAAAAGAATITATSEGKQATASITGSTVPVATVSVSPASANVAVGGTQQLSAVTRDSAGTTLTGRVVTWTSSNTTVATVSSSGLVTGRAAGAATVTATSEGKTATSAITVIVVPVATVTVSPAAATMAVGATQQLSAVTKDSAGNTLTGRVVTWTSDNTTVATVSASGLVTAQAIGAATITATSEGKTATAAITVIVVPVATVAVSPASATVFIGATRQLSAVTKDSAGNTLTGRVVTWTSDNTTVATVSASGLVTGNVAGPATITATSEGKTATAAITVMVVPVATVTVSPGAATIAIGATQQLTAVTKDSAGNTLTGRVVTWASGNTTVATASAGGLVTGIIAGSATITATSEGKNGTATITVQGGAGTHVGYYVTTGGSGGGDGSATRPWDLGTAVAGGGGRVQPGDTIWVRGGTYSGEFINAINGTAASPVILRKYPGERVTINGDLVLGGSYTWVWGFEIMRTSLVYLTGVNFGPGNQNRLINCIIHDAGASGIGFWTPSVGGEVYGNLIYNNGSTPNRDHAIYFSNNSGTKVLKDNIAFNNWAYNYHGYESTAGNLTNITIEGNVAFGASSIQLPANTASEFQVGGVPVSGVIFRNNFSYNADRTRWAARFGYSGATNNDLVLDDNELVGYVTIDPFNSVSAHRNMFYGNGLMLESHGGTGGYTWAQNTHYDGGNGWAHNGSATTFAGWKAASGLGTTDANPSTTMSGTQVFVRPNTYEAGRGHIIIYNWGGSASVSVDLSTILQPGQAFEIVNAQAYFGTPVVSGTYGGGTVALPMAAVTAPAPLWRSYTTPPVTGPTFQVFVVRLQGS